MAIWGKLSGPVQLDLGADITSKSQIRNKVWDFLEKNDIATFPKPVHNRIPNFKGSGTAGLSVAQLPEFQRAQVVKVNPDKAQEEVRYQVLDHRKTLLVPTPRLTHGLFNKLVHPGDSNKELLRKLSSRQGLAENSVPVPLEETGLKIDLVVLGSVAVDRLGHRIGKGEGFADLEFAVAAKHHEAVNQDTIVVSTVHDCQVFDSLPEDLFGLHDVPIDIIVTPTRVIRVSNKLPKPQNIIWSMITRLKFKQIGLLKEIRIKERNLGIDVALNEEKVVKKTNRLDKTRKKDENVFVSNVYICGDDGKAVAATGSEEKGRKALDRNARTKAKRKGIKLDPGIAKVKDEDNNKENVTVKNRAKVDAGRRGSKASKDENEKSEESEISEKTKSHRYNRSKMFGVFIGQMAKVTRVKDLKKALRAREVSPTELVWKGHKGIAFVYFDDGGEEILTKLTGLVVKEKLVNIEQVRVIEKEGKPMKAKNNNVENESKEVLEADLSKENGTDKKADDKSRKSKLENDNRGKVEKYSSKRGKRKINGKSQDVIKGDTSGEQVTKDDNVEIKSNIVTDELVKKEENKSENEIKLDAQKCENLHKVDEIYVQKNVMDDSQVNEIVREDLSENVPKNVVIKTSDICNEITIEPVPMFASDENSIELANVPKMEPELKNDTCKDTTNPVESYEPVNEIQVTTVDPGFELTKEDQTTEEIDEVNLSNEEINSMTNQSSVEKISENPEPKPSNSLGIEEAAKGGLIISNKNKIQKNPNQNIQKNQIFKPKAEEKLKSETLTEKAKEKKEAKIKVETAKTVTDKKAEPQTIPPEPQAETKEKLKSVKIQRNDEVRQSSITEKKVEQKTKSPEAAKEKHTSKSKEEAAASGGEKPKEKREKSKVRLDTKSKAEEKSKSATETSKEKDADKPHQEEKRKVEGKPKTLEKDEIPHPPTPVKKVASKENSSSKSSSEATTKKPAKEGSGHAGGSTASSSPVNNPETPNPDSEKDPEKCLIS